MMPSLRTGAAALLACFVLSAVPIACQSGGVGDPCTPEDEYDSTFAGFDMSLAFIESRSFQCATRICLVNHFQGRVSCPLGQAADSIKDCGGPGGAHDELCDATKHEQCQAAATFTVDCDPADPSPCTSFGAVCDKDRRICVCGADTTPPDGFFCAPAGGVDLPQRFVCHTPGACQTAYADAATNADKACCVPGSDTAVTSAVCGQCGHASKRDTDQAVYCSCRCGVADGQPPEPNFDFCTCPDGFSCTEVRPAYGVGDQLLSGKYCIKEGSAYAGDPVVCGTAPGNHDSPCNGLSE